MHSSVRRFSISTLEKHEYAVLTVNCIINIIRLRKLYYICNTVDKGRDSTLISFEGFHMEEGIPIYQQILLYLKRGAVAGDIRDGDELPSRRALSALLGVNPNTVQKAYRQLEEEGLIYSHTGAKSCVAGRSNPAFIYKI